MSKTYDIVCLVSNDITYDRRMIRVCTAFADAGKKTLLVGRVLPSSQPLDHFPFDVDRVKCRYHKGPLFYAELVRRFKSFLKQISFSNLVVTDLDTILVAKSYNDSDVRVYCDLHEYYEETPELIGKSIKKWVWSKVGQSSVSSIDVMYTVNESLAGIFSKKYNRKVSVIRNLPEQIEYTTRHISIPLKTVYLGVLNPGRGLEEIIQAIINIKEITLSIIGDGPLKKELEVLASNNPRITLVGTLKPDKLTRELTQHHLGWNVLDNNSQSYYYSLANKFFDYINHGLPVLTMDFPEYRKVIHQYNCGLILEDSKVNTLEKALRRITRDISVITQWQSNCQSVMNDHNWSLESKKLLSLF